MIKFSCPLCKQPVSKSVFDKITGIWSEKQKLEANIKQKIIELKSRQADLKKEYERKEQIIKADLKIKSEKEIIRSTRLLSQEIAKLKKDKDELNKTAEKRIHKEIVLAEARAKQKYDKQLQSNVKSEVKSRLNEQKLRFDLILKEKESKINQSSQKKIDKLERTSKLALKQVNSLTRTNFEQDKKIRNLQNQLSKQNTPQVEGLLYEDNLLAALKKEFSEDKFQHTGKGGDIVQSIIHKKNVVGIIVYECKKVLKFTQSHLNQTLKAKRQRNADFGILVTNASKKGYNGFGIEKGVIIVHPAGVISLAKLLRERVVQVANLNMSKVQRDKVIQNMLEYMESAQFKNSIETIIQIVIDEYDDLKKEIKDHFHRWLKRREAYINICNEAVSVKQRTVNVITGEKTKSEIPLKKFNLQLPDVNRDD